MVRIDMNFGFVHQNDVQEVIWKDLLCETNITNYLSNFDSITNEL